MPQLDFSGQAEAVEPLDFSGSAEPLPTYRAGGMTADSIRQGLGSLVASVRDAMAPDLPPIPQWTPADSAQAAFRAAAAQAMPGDLRNPAFGASLAAQAAQAQGVAPELALPQPAAPEPYRMGGPANAAQAYMNAFGATNMRAAAQVPLILGGVTGAMGDQAGAEALLGSYRRMKTLADNASTEAAGSPLGSTLGSLAGFLPQMASTPAMALGAVAQGTDPAVAALEKGKGLGTALGLYGIGTAAGAAQVALPPAIPGRLLTRALTGAGLNTVTGTGGQALQHELAPDIVQAPTAGDAALNAGIGALFGAALGRGRAGRDGAAGGPEPVQLTPDAPLPALPPPKPISGALPHGADFSARAEPVRPAPVDLGGAVAVDGAGRAWTREQGRQALGEALQARQGNGAPQLPEPVVTVGRDGEAMTSADYLTRVKQAREAAQARLDQQQARRDLGVTPDIERTQAARWEREAAQADDNRAMQEHREAGGDELAAQGGDDVPPWWMAAQGGEVDHAAQRARVAVQETAGMPDAPGLAESVRSQIGWDSVGGRVLREADTGGLKPEVTGRTPWAGKTGPNGETGFWAMRPEQGGKISEAGAHAALDKFTAGERLNPKEQRFVDYAVTSARDDWRASQRDYHAMVEANPDWVPGFDYEARQIDHGDRVPFSRKRGDDATGDMFERGRDAMARVIAEHGDAPNAMHRDGIGSVSFYWGKPGDPSRGFAGGHGVSKIIAKRTAEGADGEAVARHMVDVIAHGKVGAEYGPAGAERLNVTMGEATAVLSKYRFGNRETWLLTGWDEPVGGDWGNQSPAYAPRPSGMQGEAGAGSGSDATTRHTPRGDLFAAPTAAERSRAAIEAKDAQRNGLTGGRADTGDGVPAEERVVDAHLAIKNPAEWTMDRLQRIETPEEARRIRRNLENSGFDGIHLKDAGQWIAFHPEQIKSASENRGTFDAASPDIRRAARDTGGQPPASESHAIFPSGVPKGLSVVSTPATERISSAINRARASAGDQGRLLLAEIEPEGLPTGLRDSFRELEVLGDLNVHVVRNLTPEVFEFNGVTTRNGAIFLAEDAQSPLVHVASHEFSHQLSRDRPDLWQELVDEWERQGRRAEWAKEAAKRGYEPHEFTDEAVADATGDAMGDPEFMERMARENPGAFRRIAEAFKTFLDSLLAKLGRVHDLGSARYWQDVQAFRDKLADVLNRYASERGGAAGGEPAPSGPAYQRAWHGTPHRGIETEGFKLVKIGTGEGAQAYGHGIYFAGERKVAESYRKGITDWQHPFKENAGQLYHAEIPESHELLDWDRPLSEQPAQVREKLRAALGDESIRQDVADYVKNTRHDPFGVDATGADVYGSLQDFTGGAKEASELLRQHGIPGLRYLDGGSRGAGEGTHNYVIWDESRLNDDVTPYYARKASTRDAYERRIDALFEGAEPDPQGVRVLDRGDVLDLAGYGDMPVVLHERHAVVDGGDNHPLPLEAWKKMPEWIDNPAAVFERQSDGHLTMIAPEKIDGRAVVIGLDPSVSPPNRSGEGPRHLVLTAYAKNNGTLPLRNRVENGDLVPKYIDERKGPSFYAGSGVQFPGRAAELRAFGKSLKTGRDLVKYRAEHPFADEAGGDDGGAPMFSRRQYTPDEADFMRQAGMRDEVDPPSAMRKAMDALRDRLPEVDPSDLRQGTIDKYHGLRKATDAVGGIRKEDDPHLAAEMIHTASTMEAVLRFGAPKLEGGVLRVNRSVPGLLDGLDPVRDVLPKWLGWMVAGRARYLEGQGRQSGFTGAQIQAGLSLARGRENDFKAAAANYVQLKKAILDLGEQTGIIDPAGRAVWDHDEHIPFYRLMDDGAVGAGTRRGLSNQSSGIRKLRGSDRALNDPLANIIANFTRLVDASMKNRAVQLAVDQLGGAFFERAPMKLDTAVIPLDQVKRKLLEKGTPQHVIDALPRDSLQGMAKMLAIAPPDGDDVVRVMRGGKPEYYRVKDPLLLRSLTAMHEGGVPTWMKPLVWTKNLLTAGATSTPDFLLRNGLRDTGEAFVTSSEKFVPVLDTVRGAVHTMMESELTQDLMMAGATFHGGLFHTGDNADTAAAIHRALRKHGIAGNAAMRAVGQVLNPARLWDMYRSLMEATEMGSREALARRKLDAGGSMLEAAHEAKDLLNFQRRGDATFVAGLTRVIPFLNARIQGADRLYRVGKTAGRRGRMAARIAAMATLSTALYWWNQEQYKDAYDELPDWSKDTFWHIAPGTKYHVTIPKPFELGMVGGTLPERMYGALKYQLTGHRDGDSGKESWDAFMRGLGNSFGLDLPAGVKPLVEDAANRDFYFDRKIESDSDKFLAPKDRKSVYTSPTMVAASRGMSQVVGDDHAISPKRLEHLWAGYTAGMGRYALGVADWALRAGTGAATTPAKHLRDFPLVGAVYQGDAVPRTTKYVEDFYQLQTDAQTKWHTIQDALKNGDKARARNVYNEHRWMLGAATPSASATHGFVYTGVRDLNKTRDQLAKLRHRQEAIYQSETMGAEAKRDALDALLQQRNAITRRAVRQYKERKRRQDMGVP